jgi:CBS-domain-containing membrane protein
MREHRLGSTEKTVVDSPLAITGPMDERGGSVQPRTNDPKIRNARSPRAAEARVALSDPALLAVTDFVFEQPVTVPRDCSLDDALQEMIRAGVRALLVVHLGVVIGIITASDIQGERPLQFLAGSGYRRHDEVEVGHIMTPWGGVAKLDWQTLGSQRVSDLVAFFGSTAATHAVVLDRVNQGELIVRGLVSRTRLERQLGLRGDTLG